MNPNAFLYGMLTGQVIEGKYHLEKLLGTGGFGAVFRAKEVVRNTVLRQLAIKIIPPAGNPNQQLKELIAATNLDHPHFIRCFVVGECSVMNGTFLYLAMELADSTLENQLQGKTLSGNAVRQIIVQVATALDHLHQEKRQVHRDLKPGNVLQVKNVWKISDFGLVRDLNVQSYAQTTNPIATIPFMPPEAFDGKVAPAWDIWSLGIMAVVLLTGELPYRFHDPTELMKRVMNGALQLPPLPAEFEPIIQGCLQREWRQRWTAKQVLDSLENRSLSPNADPCLNDLLQPQPPIQPVQPQSLILPAGNYQERLANGEILEMVSIAAGSFVMGSNDYDTEKPLHPVQVPAFYMGKYPITQAQYQAVMGSNPAKFQGQPNNPVGQVSWQDAQAFCQKLNQQTGRTYRLPTEAEWEYACRAGSTECYCFGDNENYLGDYAWYTNNSDRKTHPVGQKQPNAWGLYDLHGNVWEWCDDDWHDSYGNKPEALKQNGSTPWSSNDKSWKLLRGGSWLSFPWHCRSAYRGRHALASRSSRIGFRVVGSAA
ncbi:MAG: bifunctional serine/threonine-protein kinase/formylglycine-generating enzyme family protein [Leptolyngbyaceae bacterium]|nr:bifunctional serine/threonine-protein kinase/formylglycine-generating enzyme family protein [Leptolyngbyaceae bacterium]